MDGPAGLHIELAKADHILELSRQHQKSFFHGWSENDFSTYLQRPKTNPIYVACNSKGKVAGFMVLALSGQECELLSINVDAKWRKKGVARAILQAGFEDLLTAPATEMFLEVEETNSAAIALYQDFGFAEISQRPSYYPQKDGSRVTALVMRVVLN